MEQWRTCPTTAKYEVSDQGRIRNARTHRIIKPQLSYDGYTHFTYWDDESKKRKNILIHREVIIAFKGYQDGECDHINLIRDDNRLENLQWVSRCENSKNRKKYKRPRNKVIDIYDLNMKYLTTTDTQVEAADYCGVFHSRINKHLITGTPTSTGYYVKLHEVKND